jgi:hypothetical protein
MSLTPGGIVKRGSVVSRGGAVERGGPIETGGVVKKGRVVKRGGPTRKSRRSWWVTPQRGPLEDVPHQHCSHWRCRWTRGAGE